MNFFSKHSLFIGFVFLAFYSLIPPLIALGEHKENPVIHAEISDFDARLEYARLLGYMKRYEESLTQFQKLLEEKPDSTEVQMEIAQLFYYQKNYEEALKWIEKIPSNQQNVKIQLLFGDILVALKNYLQAESIYREALKSNPDDNLTRLKLAELLSWEKKYQESISLYLEILKTNPTDIQVRRKYAIVLMWMGREEEAAAELEATLK